MNKRAKGRYQKGRRRKPNSAEHSLTRVYDSNGPDGVKVRGNLTQVVDKFTQLADDAQREGDRVLAEDYRQHQEHYARLLSVIKKENENRVSRKSEANNPLETVDPSEQEQPAVK